MFEVIVKHAWCKRCGFCDHVCPKGVFDYRQGYYPDPARCQDCIGCKQCEFVCPDFAITVTKKEVNR